MPNNTDNNRELERLRFSYEEELALHKAKDIVVRKLLDEKIREDNLRAQNELSDLENTEKAITNLLEDSKELEERFGAIISSMGEGLLLIDKNNYEVVLMNPAAEKIWGVSSSEVIGKNVNKVAVILKGDKIIPEEERPVARMFQTGLAITVGMEDNFYCQDISGRKFPVALMVSPIKGDSITGAVVIFRDVTEEKRLDESKINFISVSSHQLRTPLTAIKWFSEMLLDGEAGVLSDEQKNFIDKISQSAERMVNLVNLLLQIARVEMGRLKVEPEPVDLINITQKIIASFKNILDPKSQKIEVKTDPANIPLIQLDKEMVWQVILNLLTNASRYSPVGGTISVSIILSSKGGSASGGKNQFIEYAVKDSGIGIPENQKSRLFEKFFRANNAVKAVPEGSGLGLFLVKSLVEGWGGKIWFESPAFVEKTSAGKEEGKGATFFFTVPLDGIKRKEGEVTLKV